MLVAINHSLFLGAASAKSIRINRWAGISLHYIKFSQSSLMVGRTDNYVLWQPLLFDHRKTMFIQKYGCLIADKLISPEQVFGVVRLKQLCRCV